MIIGEFIRYSNPEAARSSGFPEEDAAWGHAAYNQAIT